MNVNGNETKLNSKFKGFKSFDWDDYSKEYSNLTPAPKECFNQNAEPPVNEFEVKQKLEITSPDNVDFVYLATVVNFYGSRIQVRLDGCDNSNDIFELVDSETINPVGTRQIRNKYFAAPLRFRKDAASYNSFCQQILKTSVHAPKSAFKSPPKPPLKNMFKVGMMLEAVDIKHPSNICPAKIVDVDRNHVEIHLLGWDSNNDYKCSYLSRHLFPVGWCKSTGHPLQHPGPKVESKICVKKETTVINATSNANSESKDSQQNNIKIDEVKPVQDGAVINEPKPIIPIVSSTELRVIMQTNSNKTFITNSSSTTSVNASQVSVTTTTPVTITTSSIATKQNATIVVSKSNSDHSVASRNKTNTTQNNVLPIVTASVNSKERGLKRPFEQTVNSGITNSVITQLSSNKPNLQLTPVSQAKTQPKATCQPMPCPQLEPSVTTQASAKVKPQLGTQAKLAIHIKPTTQQKVSTQSKVAIQHKTLNQPILSPQVKPTVQQQILSSQQSTPISQIKPTLQSKPQIPTNVVSSKVPIVNGNKPSSVSIYTTNFPNTKVVNSWSIEEVIDFLNLRLPEFSKYENQFRSHEIDGKAFLLLTNESIMKFMNIKLGYSLKICNIVDKIIESDS